jgi:hypothetical protein
MLISDLTQHGECKEGHLVATRFKTLSKTCKTIAIFYIPYNLMCYNWVSLRKSWGIFVYANQNIITYITKKSSICNLDLL